MSCLSPVRGEWAHFRITEGAATELAGVTLDEEEALVPASKFLAAIADPEARVLRIVRQSSSMDGKTRKRSKPILLNRSARNLAAAQETSEIKRALTGKEQAPTDNVPESLQSPNTGRSLPRRNVCAPSTLSLGVQSRPPDSMRITRRIACRLNPISRAIALVLLPSDLSAMIFDFSRCAHLVGLISTFRPNTSS
jgi:hypothetical protein